MYLSVPLMESVLYPSAKRHASVLTRAAIKFNIDNERRLSCWLGQMHIESKGFAVTKEDLHYKAETLIRIFGRHRISIADANKYGSIPGRQKADPKAIASRIYGGDWGRRELGNLYADDAWRFIGRGFKQVTGRYNYTVTSDRMFGDERLLVHPEILEAPEYAALSAGDFWDWKKLNTLADKLDHIGIIKTITGGLGDSVRQNDRIEQSDNYLQRIRNSPVKRPDFSNVVSGSSTVPITKDGE